MPEAIFIKSTIPSSDFTLFRYPRKEDA